MRSPRLKLLLVLCTLAGIILTFTYAINRTSIDFTTQVKPILNKNCITCHGGVKQKAGFSLLFREEALANTESGKPAIIPGDPEHSEIIRRITINDPEERMPYKHDPLDRADIDILKQWIKEGANWGRHWAYVPVKHVPLPESSTFFGLVPVKSNWARNPVDQFIEQKLKEQDLEPSPQAEKQLLLRRVSLDIIGLPAPPALAAKFLKNTGANAYGELVDSLLASPRYGEKWTAMWLDLARYADTKGYEADQGRNIWRYRDWLIHAFNDDKPYDQFLAEQLAGDLMPDATDEQFIATAFHRNTMTNDEGGTDNEEFRTSAVMDRVSTTWEATMGTTFACVQCHSHPYDPFRHEEYYKFMAFFNNTRDEDTEADYPLLRHYNDSMLQELAVLEKWLKQYGSPEKARETYTFLKTWQPSYNSMACDSFINSELASSWWVSFRDKAMCRMKNVDLSDKDQLIFRYSGMAGGGIWRIHTGSADGPVIATINLSKTKDWEIAAADLKPVDGRHDLYFTYSNTSLKTPADAGVLLDWLYFTNQFPGRGQADYANMKEKYWKLLRAKVPATLVMMDNPASMRRQSHVFERGNWLLKGNTVEPDVPQSLNPFPANAPRNRLGLAKWLTSPENPLTARTLVNRVWEQLFGAGLAETLEDLGSQGIAPTHVELLDWLSYQFMHDYNWSLKKLIRTIVMSATYQQHSQVTPSLLEKDIYNKFYARGARVRLSAEQIRDQALFVSGLLSDKMYGPSVFPWQPDGIWLSPWNGSQWEQSAGEDRYRRALYTYWKRSAPYPSMISFDGVTREVCSSRRIRTNTPLQALTTLNDSVYIDLARHFALRIQKEAGGNVNSQVSRGFELATGHGIDDKSLQSLLKLYTKAIKQFKSDPEKLRRMMGEKAKASSPETAALAVVANAILNLDEVLTKN